MADSRLQSPAVAQFYDNNTRRVCLVRPRSKQWRRSDDLRWQLDADDQWDDADVGRQVSRSAQEIDCGRSLRGNGLRLGYRQHGDELVYRQPNNLPVYL